MDDFVLPFLIEDSIKKFDTRIVHLFRSNHGSLIESLCDCLIKYRVHNAKPSKLTKVVFIDFIRENYTLVQGILRARNGFKKMIKIDLNLNISRGKPTDLELRKCDDYQKFKILSRESLIEGHNSLELDFLLTEACIALNSSDYLKSCFLLHCIKVNKEYKTKKNKLGRLFVNQAVDFITSLSEFKLTSDIKWELLLLKNINEIRIS